MLKGHEPPVLIEVRAVVLVCSYCLVTLRPELRNTRLQLPNTFRPKSSCVETNRTSSRRILICYRCQPSVLPKCHLKVRLDSASKLSREVLVTPYTVNAKPMLNGR